MALTICPDCEGKVSQSAKACPHCGCPMFAMTVEQTGKDWKIVMIVAGVMMGVGFVALPILRLLGVSGNEWPWILSVAVIVLGFGLYYFARIGSWWHHG